MYFFRERIEAAYLKNSLNVDGIARYQNGRNDTIYSRLLEKFSFDDAHRETVAEKGNGCSRNMVKQMLKNWKKQGLIVCVGKCLYQKVA